MPNLENKEQTGHRLLRSYRIRQNRDYRRIYRSGKRFSNRAGLLYVTRVKSGDIRIGFVTTKKIGHAVQRNRARRIMRAALSEHLSQNIGGYDIILVARARTPYLKSTQLSKTLAGLMRKAGLPDKAAAVPQQPAAKPQPNGAPE